MTGMDDGLKAEQFVIGGMLLGSLGIHQVVGQLDCSDFGEPLHGELFNTMMRLWEGGEAINPVSVRAALTDRTTLTGDLSDYLPRLVTNLANCLSPGDYVPLVRDSALRRQVTEVCQRYLQGATEQGEVSANDLVAGMATDVDRLLTGSATKARRSEKEVLIDLVEGMKLPSSVVSTGFSRLDEAMGGGLHAGFSYGIGGRKKMGKTMLLGSISYHLSLAGVKHVYICAEMSDTELLQRKLAYRMGCYASRFRNPRYRGDVDFQQRVYQAGISLGNHCQYIKKPGITFESLKAELLSAVHQERVSGFILDYWQLVGGKGRKNLVEHLDEVAQWLADFSRKYGVWNITASQINQEGNTRGGEGLRLAYDQVYRIEKESEESQQAWLELMDTRYTPWNDVGEKHAPALEVDDKSGTFFVQI